MRKSLIVLCVLFVSVGLAAQVLLEVADANDGAAKQRYLPAIVDGDKRVLLIDMDLYKGHLNQYFGLARTGGLSEILAGEITPEQAQELIDLLWVKFDEITLAKDSGESQTSSSYPDFQNLNIGGLTRGGRDAERAELLVVPGRVHDPAPVAAEGRVLLEVLLLRRQPPRRAVGQRAALDDRERVFEVGLAGVVRERDRVDATHLDARDLDRNIQLQSSGRIEDGIDHIAFGTENPELSQS